MKINSLSLISVVAVLSGTGVANAGMLADFYVGAMAGLGGQTIFDKENTTDYSKVYGAVAGVDIPVLRIEAEYNYLDSKDLNTNSAMLNLYAKMPSTIILPYIGGGIGMVFGGDHNGQDIDSVIAYQAMFGLTVDTEIMPLKFDIEAHTLYAPDIYKNDITTKTPDMLQYGVRAKMRYVF